MACDGRRCPRLGSVGAAQCQQPHRLYLASFGGHDVKPCTPVTVPPGTTAQVVLPDGTSVEASPGTWLYDCRVDVD